MAAAVGGGTAIRVRVGRASEARDAAATLWTERPLLSGAAGHDAPTSTLRVNAAVTDVRAPGSDGHIEVVSYPCAPAIDTHAVRDGQAVGAAADGQRVADTRAVADSGAGVDELPIPRGVAAGVGLSRAHID